MTIFDGLTLLGGLCLFLFGMSYMGGALERFAGNGLRNILGKLTTNRVIGLLTGIGITAVIQSSSASTVMVVGFVNSNLMNLSQAINVIMGANIGTTVTAWILSLTGISGDNFFMNLLKPSSFVPVLAVIGIYLYMFNKKPKKRDIGSILLGFATLMYGMTIMSGSVAGLQSDAKFQSLFLIFQNPILGVLLGMVLTCIIQSSSASVGILQALAATGAVTYGIAIPIVMGDAIGTCITAMLSSIGTNKNAQRAALAHLSFNIIGTGIWLIVYCVVRAIFAPAILTQSASLVGIATVNTIFKLLSTFVLWPMAGLLEKIVKFLVPDKKGEDDEYVLLDPRFLDTPSLAVQQSRDVTITMATETVEAFKKALRCLSGYSENLEMEVVDAEKRADHFEDILGTYLTELSIRRIGEHDSAESGKLLKIIGDIERISDHTVNLVQSAKEMHEKKLPFSKEGSEAIQIYCQAVNDMVEMTLEALTKDDIEISSEILALEQVVNGLKDDLRTLHIKRLQQGKSNMELGFIWSDLLTDLERIGDHCSNIANCIIDMAENQLNLHAAKRIFGFDSDDFMEKINGYEKKYALPQSEV